jgi:hypothetical protein
MTVGVGDYKVDAGIGKTEYPGTVVGDAIKFLGASLLVGDPQKAGWPLAKNWEDTQRRGRKELYQLLDDKQFDKDTFVSTLQEQRRNEQEAFKELVEFDKALTLTGMRPRDRVDMLEAIGLSNKSVIAGIMKGRNLDNVTTLLSSSSFKQQLENEAAKLPENQREAYKSLVNANAKIIRKDLGLVFSQ